MKKFIIFSFFLVFILLMANSCKEDDNLMSSEIVIKSPNEDIPDWTFTQEEYNIIKTDLPNFFIDNEIPLHEVNFPSYLRFENAPLHEDNPHNHQAILGRVFFYDKKLSINETISCGSCHKQDLAFADEKSFSLGFNGDETIRNSYALGSNHSNEEYYFQAGLDWVLSHSSVFTISRSAVKNPIEMGIDDEEVLLRKIKDTKYYQILFEKVWNGRDVEDIHINDIYKCIEFFVLSMNSLNSRFDVAYNDPNFHSNNFDPFLEVSTFTSQENLGKFIYMNSCAACHSSTFSIPEKSSANNGLDLVYDDKGIGAPSNDNAPSKYGVFKVPILRNIEHTAPYMHDGRFSTLEEVIEHYSSGIKAHSNLHELLPAGGFGFSEEEKEALHVFLKTVSDNQLLTDKRFSTPFID